MNITKKTALYILALLSLCSISNAAEIINILPDSSTIHPFQPSSEPELFDRSTLYNHINGAAELYFEYGFEECLHQRYEHGHTSITLDVYQMVSPEAAFGIYSQFRDPEKEQLDFGDSGVEYEYQISFWQDRYYVVLLGNDAFPETKAHLKKIGRSISDKLGHADPPSIMALLPQQHRVPRSEGFISGLLGLNRQFYLTRENILGIDGKTVSAAFAAYSSNEDQANLLVVAGPELIAKRGEVELLFSKKYRVHSKKPLLFIDQRNRYYAVKSGPQLLIAHRASSPEIIKELFGWK